MKLPENFALLLCVSIPSFMINLDMNIVAVSLTSISHSLGASFVGIEWVISAYTLTFASFLMLAGTLADRFGRKRILLAGLSIFAIASILCGAAPSVEVLNVARALQGVGAALQLSAALAILSHTFQGRTRGRAFAFWGSVIGIAIMMGPPVGGLVTQVLGWRWVFYLNVPIAGVMLVLTKWAVTDTRDPQATKLDIAGVLTFSGFLSITTLALISGNKEGWSAHSVDGEFFAGAILLISFFVVESRQEQPMVDLRFFRIPTYIGANVAGLVYAVTFLTMLTYLPVYFQNVMGETPMASGLMMLPIALPLFLVPRLITRFAEHRASGRTLLAGGLALVAVGLAITASNIATLDYWHILTSMLVASVGAGILNAEVTKVGMTVIPVERAGMASGVASTVRISGIVVGFAALGAIMYAQIERSAASSVSTYSAADRIRAMQDLANGVAAKVAASTQFAQIASLEDQILIGGYQAALIAAALLAAVAALLAWFLISAEQTSVVRMEKSDTDAFPLSME